MQPWAELCRFRRGYISIHIPAVKFAKRDIEGRPHCATAVDLITREKRPEYALNLISDGNDYARLDRRF